jgi:predicted nucleic acid-binding protein
MAAQALEYNLVFVTNDKIERIREVCAAIQIENWTV